MSILKALPTMLCIVVTCGTPLFWADHELRAAVSMGFAGIIWLLYRRRIEYLVLYAGMACLGIAGESAGILSGSWLYPAAHAYALFPLWAPLIWANGALLFIALESQVFKQFRRSC